MIGGSAVIARAADQIVGFGIPIFVVQQSGSIASGVVALALRGLGYVLSPLLGVIIDRYDRRWVYAVAQLEQAICIIAAGLLAQTQPVLAAVALALSSLGGATSSITGMFVLIPQTVPAALQKAAVGRLSTALEITKVAGYLSAGALITVIGPAFAVGSAAGLYVAAGVMGLLLRVPQVKNLQAPQERMRLLDGIRWLRRNRTSGVLAITMTMSNLAVGAVDAAIIGALTVAGLPPSIVGAVFAAALIAGVVGTMTPIFTSLREERQILAWQVVVFVGLLLVMVPSTPIRIAGIAVMHLGFGGSNVVSIQFRQGLIPLGMAGRVNSVMRMFITGAVPLSGFFYAASESALGQRLVWIPSAIVALVSLLIWAAASGRAAAVDDEPH